MTTLASRDLSPEAYPEFADVPLLAETLELFRSVRDHDLHTLSRRCDDDFGIVNIDTDGSSRMIRTREEHAAWFTDLFTRLDEMQARTDTELTSFQTRVAVDMAFSVVEFRQFLHVDGQKMAYDCVTTIVWKRQNDEWIEARWHGSLLSGPTPA